jgi:hypothetical protein
MDGFVHVSRRMCPSVCGRGEYLGKFAYIFLYMHACNANWMDKYRWSEHACMGPPFTSLGPTRTPTIYCDASQLFYVPACGTVCEVYMHAAGYVRTLRKLPNSSFPHCMYLVAH